MSLVRRSTRAVPWIANGRVGALAEPQARHQRRPAATRRAARTGRGGGVEQLGGVAAGVRRVADAGEHARQLARRARRRRRPRPSATVRSLAPALRLSSTAFSTTTCVPANAATCARCVTQSTWWRDPSACRRRPTATPASPPIPASTSSNTRRRRCLREHHARGQHRTGELATGRGPGQRSGASRPGWARAGRSTRSCAVVGGLARLDLHVDHRVRHRQLAQVHLDRARQGRGRVAARRGELVGRGRVRRALVVGAPRLDRGGALLVAPPAPRAGPPTRRRRRSRRRGSTRTCDPARAAGDAGRGPASTRCGIVVDPVDRVAQLLLDVGELALRARAGGAASSANGARPSSAASAPPSGVDAGPSSASYASVERVAVRDRVGEEQLLGFERDVLGRDPRAAAAAISSTW